MFAINSIPRENKLTPAAVLAVVLLLFCGYYYQVESVFSFNYELTRHEQYGVAVVVLSGWTLWSVMLLFKRSLPVPPLLPLLLGCLLIGWLCWSRYYSLANEYFVQVSCIILLMGMVIYAGQRLLPLIVWLFVLVLLIQIGIACFQMGGLALDIRSFNVQGSLQNTGIFCNYLVIQLPFLYYLLFVGPASTDKPLRHRKAAGLVIAKILVFSLVLCFTTWVVWKTTTRTAMVMLLVWLTGLVMSTLGKTIKSRLSRLPRIVIVAGAGLILLSLMAAAQVLFKAKMLSAVGRMMKLDIAAGHWKDHFLTGTGVGRFTWYYPQWQSHYFTTHPTSPDAYFLSADESYILFNEPIQLFHTIGLAGMIGVVMGLILFFNSRSAKQAKLLTAVKMTMVLLLTGSLFSYPLHVNILLLQGACCVAASVILHDGRWRWLDTLYGRVPVPVGKAIITLAVVAGGFATYTAGRQWRAVNCWQQIGQQELSPAQRVQTYESLRASLPCNGKFLTSYGMFLLSQQKDAAKAIQVLEAASTYFISKRTIELLAEAYRRDGHLREAITRYEWLSGYLPSRFAIKFRLLNLYHEAGERDKATAIAQLILRMPVKIPSDEVDRIKRETSLLLSTR
ncbi:tetratricopeptide repeat protein [Paraflavitalea pollutisoli]|uniref:tetratricopeptide repeat protein n=1 Tax=Paraflavitalea pollutisoli TaxID=3034143 RepID=UPI0023EC7FBF|nr:tetratricopeptide repeat protein [Paraflavitalea sp. H1-2-19X]